MEDHYEALEADFQREYGLHLGECLQTMGCRRLEALINGLPPNASSAVARSIDEGIRIGWGFNEELLAALIEVLDVGNRNFLAAHGVKKHQLPKPVYIHRPLQPKQERKATPADIKEIFSGGPIIMAAKEAPEENNVEH